MRSSETLVDRGGFVLVGTIDGYPGSSNFLGKIGKGLAMQTYANII